MKCFTASVSEGIGSSVGDSVASIVATRVCPIVATVGDPKHIFYYNYNSNCIYIHIYYAMYICIYYNDLLNNILSICIIHYHIE